MFGGPEPRDLVRQHAQLLGVMGWLGVPGELLGGRGSREVPFELNMYAMHERCMHAHCHEQVVVAIHSLLSSVRVAMQSFFKLP